MKSLILPLCFICLTNLVSGQEFKFLDPNLDDSCKIIKATIDTVYFYEQIVFIDFKVKSKVKDKIASFEISERDLKQMNEIYYDILEYNSSKRVKQPLPEKWIKVHKYKGDWILFDNPEYNVKYIISDTALIRYGMDGVYASPFTKYEELNGWHMYEYFPTFYGDPKNIQKNHLWIKILDTEKQISLWKFNRNGQIDFELRIPEERKTRFPAIGVISTDLVGDEYMLLDKIDYEKLTKLK